MKMTTSEIRMIEAQYLAMTAAAIEGKSIAVAKMLGSQARAEIAVSALVNRVQGDR